MTANHKPALWILGTLCSLLVGIAAQCQISPALLYSNATTWVAESGQQISNETVQAPPDSYITIYMTCNPGPYLPYCGQPEIYNGANPELLGMKVPLRDMWTDENGMVEQIFSIHTPVQYQPQATIWDPTLMSGIVEKRVVEVHAGPTTEF